MKVAEVKYTGPMQSKSVRLPSGKKFSLSNPMGGSPIPKDVTSVADAEYFERNDSVFDVEWTTQGELLKATAGPVKDAQSVLKDLTYHKKRSLVSTFDLSPESQAEEDINDVLEDEIDGMVKQMRQNE